MATNLPFSTISINPKTRSKARASLSRNAGERSNKKHIAEYRECSSATRLTWNRFIEGVLALDLSVLKRVPIAAFERRFLHL